MNAKAETSRKRGPGRPPKKVGSGVNDMPQTEDLVAMYKDMLLIRRFEEKAGQLQTGGSAACLYTWQPSLRLAACHSRLTRLSLAAVPGHVCAWSLLLPSCVPPSMTAADSVSSPDHPWSVCTGHFRETQAQLPTHQIPD